MSRLEESFVEIRLQTQATFSFGTIKSSGTEGLARIFDNAKRQQWDANTAIDWSSVLSEDNPLAMPDGTIAIADSPVWDRMSQAERADVRSSVQGWQISQILHGEHASLMCALKIAQAEPKLDVKYCAAMQAADEARHIEVYSRLLREKLRHSYPVSPALRSLFEDIIRESRYDFAALGMQVVVEGMALAFFRNLQAYSHSEFIRNLQSLVLRDEARHFALGRLTLRPLYRELSAHELAEREEFLIEACHRLHEHLCAEEIWRPLGLTKQDCRAYVRASRITANLQRTLFRHIVPAVRDVGLLGPSVTEFFRSVGAFDYAEYASP